MSVKAAKPTARWMPDTAHWPGAAGCPVPVDAGRLVVFIGRASRARAKLETLREVPISGCLA